MIHHIHGDALLILQRLNNKQENHKSPLLSRHVLHPRIVQWCAGVHVAAFFACSLTITLAELEFGFENTATTTATASKTMMTTMQWWKKNKNKKFVLYQQQLGREEESISWGNGCAANVVSSAPTHIGFFSFTELLVLQNKYKNRKRIMKWGAGR